jgi:hypothetical protein
MDAGSYRSRCCFAHAYSSRSSFGSPSEERWLLNTKDPRKTLARPAERHG